MFKLSLLLLAALAMSCQNANADCLDAVGGADALVGKQLIRHDANKLTRDLPRHNPATQVLEATLPANHRIASGLFMTMEYIENRLTVQLGDDNEIVNAFCG